MNEIARQKEQKRIENIVNQMKQYTEIILPKAENVCCAWKKVVLFIEDSGSGYLFIKAFIEQCYPMAQIELVSLHGHGNIKYIPYYIDNSDCMYDDVIIMYDRGRSSGNSLNDNNRKDIPRVVRRLKNFNEDVKIHIYSPLCFESILMSCSLLLDVFLRNYTISKSLYTKLHRELVDLINGKIISIDWLAYVNFGLSIEKILEKAIFEITKNTEYQISHSPSYISDCWVKNCDDLCEKLNKNCNLMELSKDRLENQHKLELIAIHSVLGGFSYIMDKIYCETKISHYPFIIENNTEYKAMLIQEA